MAISNINGATKEEMIQMLSEVNITPEPTLSAMREQARIYNKSLKQSSSDSPQQNEGNSDNASQTTNIVNNYYQSINTNTSVHSWGIKFSGSSDVRDFIQRVEELSRCRHIELSSVVTSFADLLEGKALSWYRTIYKDSLSWPDLRNLLVARFDRCINQTEALKALFAMKQKFNQSVVDYVDEIKLANLRLDVHLTEEQLVDLVSDSLLPKYALAIAYFAEKDLSSLVNVCRRFEKHSVDKPLPHFTSPQATSSSSTHSSSSNSRKTLNCFYCKAQGHTKPFCRKWKFDSQKNYDKRRDDPARTNPKN